MKLEFDAELKNFFKQYENRLKSYPISSKRRREKVAQFKAALRNLRDPSSYPICDKKDLGQIFDSNGKPILKELRQTYYQDKSGYQWRFSFFKNGDKIKVFVIIGSECIEESIFDNYYKALHQLIYN